MNPVEKRSTGCVDGIARSKKLGSKKLFSNSRRKNNLVFDRKPPFLIHLLSGCTSISRKDRGVRIYSTVYLVLNIGTRAHGTTGTFFSYQSRSRVACDLPSLTELIGPQVNRTGYSRVRLVPSTPGIQLAVALLRWRNILVKVAVFRKSRRGPDCAQRNTRFFGRATCLAVGPKDCCGFLKEKLKHYHFSNLPVAGEKMSHLFEFTAVFFFSGPFVYSPVVEQS